MKISETIRSKAREYSRFTAENLSEIIRIPSPSGEEKAVIEKLQKQCRKAGFDGVRVDGLGNLITRIGAGPRKLAIDAHIDTVGPGDLEQWEFHPFCGDIREGMVLGRGTVDQSGGAAAMITAGRILKETGYDGEFSIYFTFTVMEEDCDGLCWNYLIEREGLVPDFAVSTEPTNLNLYRGHRGRMEIECRFHGLSCHGSAPERGENAIYMASRAALEIEKLDDHLPADNFLGKGSAAVTFIESESPSLCAVPDLCKIHIDRRLTQGESKESALAELFEIIGPKTEPTVPVYNKESYTGLVFEQEKYFPTWAIPEASPLVRAGAATGEILFGAPPKIGKWTFSTNGVAICGKHGIPTIGFGPGNEKFAHAPNEAVPIEHLARASAFYAMLPYVLEKLEM